MLLMEAFHNHSGIITNYLRWSLSDPEAQIIADDARVMVKGLPVIHRAMGAAAKRVLN